MQTQNALSLLAREPLSIRKSGFEITSKKEEKSQTCSAEEIGGVSLIPRSSGMSLRSMRRQYSVFYKKSGYTKSRKRGGRLHW